ncbi:AdoMet-dependent rRNA methyltransferase SPB1 [Smittium culicis]|uniref:AdoMet-dependent rRNA methyltransferase SPB1 n=1 Tax=Smittium culicis TaxID=133412 RepID=A0A1R1Y6H4_9FUNG|nr:AdoMet-dependent rRNA methyltransferase SPB1 [Smittium culicis]
MTTPMDIGMDQGDETLFSVKNKPDTKISDSKKIRKLTKEIDLDTAAELAEQPDSDEELEYYEPDIHEIKDKPLDSFGQVDSTKLHALSLENELDSMYERYTSKIRERDSKIDIKKKRSMEEEFRGFSSDDDEDKITGRKKKSSKLSKIDDNNSDDGLDVDSRRQRKLEIDDSDSDSGSSDDNSNRVPGYSSDSSDDEQEILEMKKQAKKDKIDLKNKKLLGVNANSVDDSINSVGKLSKKASLWFDQPLFKDLSVNSILQSQKVSTTSSSTNKKRKGSELESNKSTTSTKKSKGDDGLFNPNSDDLEDGDLEVESLVPEVEEFVDPNEDAHDQRDYSQFANPEALTLAHALVNKKISKADLIDKYFNRHSYNDMGELPLWFSENERQFNRPNIPITKEAADMLRAKMKAINARPIKKIVEAKARKKLHANQRMNKLKAKAESMANNDDMTEAEKAKNIEKLMKSNVNKAANKKNKVKVVVAKGGNRGLKGRPKGTKGRYKMVDSRLKKDARAEKVKKSKGSKRR